MYTPRNNFPQEFCEYAENGSSKIFSCIRAVRIQAPHVFAEKLIPQEFFPACIGFVPGGTFCNAGWLPHLRKKKRWEAAGLGN